MTNKAKASKLDRRQQRDVVPSRRDHARNSLLRTPAISVSVDANSRNASVIITINHCSRQGEQRTETPDSRLIWLEAFFEMYCSMQANAQEISRLRIPAGLTSAATYSVHDVCSFLSQRCLCLLIPVQREGLMLRSMTEVPCLDPELTLADGIWFVREVC